MEIPDIYLYDLKCLSHHLTAQIPFNTQAKITSLQKVSMLKATLVHAFKSIDCTRNEDTQKPVSQFEALLGMSRNVPRLITLKL